MGSVCSNSPIVMGDGTVPKDIHKLNKFSNVTNIRQRFEFISQLGMGSFGKVRLYRDRFSSDILYAIKTLRKQGIPPKLYECLKQEIAILSTLDHPNIVKYYGTFEDSAYIHIVMEYLQGDNLYKMILKKSVNEINEKEMSLIIHQLLNALNFIHTKNIVHRDIKPENIVFGIKDDYTTLKLIDFGLATQQKSNDKTAVGTPYYMAPEMVDGVYTAKSDIWSVGILLHLMVTGKFPFDNDKKNDIFYYIQNKKFDTKDLKDSECSEEIRDLIQKMLIKDPKKRISTQECLNHPWIINNKEKTITYKQVYNVNTARVLKQFAGKSKVQKEIYFFLAKIIKDDELKKLKDMFLQIDTSGDGELSFDEIRDVFFKAGTTINENEIRVICEGLDFHNDGKINYTEFLAAMISEYSFIEEEKLWPIFCYFTNSKDENDIISAEDIIEKANNLHINVDEEELKKCFEKLRKTGKSLSFKNFKKMIKNEEYKNVIYE